MKPVDEDYRIYGRRIYLRSITFEDTDMVLEWRNSKNVVENFIYRKPITRQEHLDWLENKVKKGLVHQFIICDKVDDTPYGCIYLQNFEEESSKAESGIFLGSIDKRPRGIGAEAESLLIEYCFNKLGLHKVVARVLAYNAASLRLHENTGYIKEAYLKDELYIDGKYEDLVFYGIINPQHNK